MHLFVFACEHQIMTKIISGLLFFVECNKKRSQGVMDLRLKNPYYPDILIKERMKRVYQKVRKLY